MDRMHEANRRAWDAVSANWQARVGSHNQWERAHTEPTVALLERELEWLGDVFGRDVCVLGSGDNLAVFALGGLGAYVTSVDISQSQLDIAAERATALGLNFTFIRADVTDLGALEDETFDAVYTGGHVAVWVSDLRKYYREACRILKPGASFIVNEYHPFRRIWKESTSRLQIEAGYFERGPFEYDRSKEALWGVAGSLPSYEFHWTMSDYVAAMLDAGCELVAVDEIGDQPQGWERTPLQGLPENLLLLGRKR